MKKILSVFISIALISGTLFLSPQTYISAQNIIVNTSGEIVLDRVNNHMEGIAPGGSLSALQGSLSSSSGVMRFLNSSGEVITSGATGTGMKVQLLNTAQTVVEDFTIIIYGDVNGTGGIEIDDMSLVKSHLLNTNMLTESKYSAADLYSKGSVTVSDLLGIKKDLLNIDQINQNPKSLTVETPTDATTFSDLYPTGSVFTENFTKNELIPDSAFYPLHRSVVTGVESIAGSSIKCDFTVGQEAASTYFFGSKGKFVSNGKYRLTASYKFITPTAPTGFYFGFNRDGGLNQKNIQVDFNGKLPNTVYTFTADYSLENFDDYYFDWFNLSNDDGSILVIDSIRFERLPNLADLTITNRPVVEKFTTGSSALSPSSIGTIISGPDAIDGESLSINTASSGIFYFFQTGGNMALNSTYKIKFKFKVLNAPVNGAYGLPAFYVGLTLNGGGDEFKQINLLNKTDGQVYESEDYMINTGNSSNYFVNFYVAHALPINIVIDDFIITKVNNLADLMILNKPFVEEFITGATILSPSSIATIISGPDAITGESLSINTSSGGIFYFFQTKGLMAQDATYKVNFKFKVLNAPVDGALGLPAFHIGLTQQGGGNNLQQLDLLGKTDGQVYQSPDIIFTTPNTNEYFPSIYIQQPIAINIVMDDYTITRIS